MKIVLAMDSSTASQVALEEAAARPWLPGSAFEVVSVVEPSHLWTTSEVPQEALRRAENVVASAVELLSSKGWAAAGGTLTGDPKTIILDRVREVGADLLMVGSHGVSAISRFLLGSVASGLLRYAPCSVEVVRARAGNKTGNLKILLATDGSEGSERAARSMAERPWPAGAEVRILTTVELMLSATRVLLEPPFLDSEFLETARAEAMQRAQDAIARATEILSPRGFAISDSISVLVAPPKAIILDEAAGWGADLIVLGSHGRNGVERFLLGSVSEAVAMHASCSVEVIRMNAAAKSSMGG